MVYCFINYCPGGELPRYEFRSYKPSCSRRVDWVLKIDPGPGYKENVKNISDRRGDTESDHLEVSKLENEFSAWNIRELGNKRQVCS